MTAAGDAELDALLAEPEQLRCVYQPVVDLRSGEVVAFEALARGPEGSPLERPDALFGAARRSGRLTELDWRCRATAVAGALAGRIAGSVGLFLNVEPETLGSDVAGYADALLERAGGDLDIVVEFTERALADRPAELQQAVGWCRRRGFGVAVDDVGAEPASLALMPFLEPDVIKLDLRLVQQQPDVEIATVLQAVQAQAERSGATVLAEGIENEDHADLALAMGATVGQGWHLGRPGDLPPEVIAPSAPLELIGVRDPDLAGTPFDLLVDRRLVREGDAPLLHAVSRFLETQTGNLVSPPVLLAAFQEARRFVPVAARFERFAQHCTFVAVLAQGLDGPTAGGGVRTTDLAPDDPLTGEWTVVVVGPHFAGALIAREIVRRSGPRRFEFATTHDRDLVVAAGQRLLGRIVAGIGRG